MSKLKTPIIITDHLHEHPAIIAWRKLGLSSKEPKEISLLKKHNKSNVFLLNGIGPHGKSIIAKKAPLSTAMLERFIYENVLSCMSKTTLNYYGHIEAEDQTCWIFIEDANGNPFSFKNIYHTSLAIDWLTELHTCVPRLDCLTVRGIEYYFSHLITAHDAIISNLSNQALCDADIRLLKSIISHLQYIRHRWDIICKLYEQMPKGFIHGDFTAKNLRVRSDNHRSALFVFDWELAGWGLPGIDMWRLGPEDYWLRVRNHWNNIALENIVQLSNLGKLLRCVNAIEWASHSLRSNWLASTIRNMQSYKVRLDSAIPVIFSLQGT